MSVKTLTIQEIEQALAQGDTQIGGFKVRIHSQANGRYRADIVGPRFNTVCETPTTIPTEGIKSFYSRLATRLADLMRQAQGINDQGNPIFPVGAHNSLARAKENHPRLIADLTTENVCAKLQNFEPWEARLLIEAAGLTAELEDQYKDLADRQIDFPMSLYVDEENRLAQLRLWFNS